MTGSGPVVPTPPAEVPAEWEQAVSDDIYTEIGLALGWDDSDDDALDIKRTMTDKIMRHVSRMVADAERAARVAALLEAYEAINAAHDEHPVSWGPGLRDAARIVTKLREATQ